MAMAARAYHRYGAIMITTLALLGAPAYAGPILAPAPDARFALALYCSPICDDATIDALEVGLEAIPGRSSFPDEASRPMRIMGIAGPEFGIPDEEFIATYGSGVDRPAALAGAQEVLLAWFAAPPAEARRTLAAAHHAFSEAARIGGGWVEDLDTQTVYGAAAWAEKDPNGPVTDWFVVDATPADSEGNGPYRLITRGLRRFGGYELVVPDVAPAAAADVSFVLNAVATREVDGEPGLSVVPLDTDTVRGVATLSDAEPIDGDPAPPLLKVSFKGEIGPRGAPAPTPPPAEPEPVAELALPAAPLPPIEPAPDPSPPPAAAAPVASDAPAPPAPAAPPAPRTLAEAQEQALTRFDTVVRAAWDAGLPAGEKIAVSAPFPTRSGSVEYIWVELRSWSDDRLAGVLVNEPYDVPELRRGDRVELSRADVFDYVWKREDGTREGNTTAPFLRR